MLGTSQQLPLRGSTLLGGQTESTVRVDHGSVRHVLCDLDVQCIKFLAIGEMQFLNVATAVHVHTGSAEVSESLLHRPVKHDVLPR